MELQLFDLVNEALDIYDNRVSIFGAVEKRLNEVYADLTSDKSNSVIAIHSRIKSRQSVQEKLIRNKFYQFCNTGEDCIDELHDIIGIIIECRFIRNEADLYHRLYKYFDTSARDFCQCLMDENNYLNLHVAQPQLQRNGFTIFRIDGYYMYEGKRVNYELQIKALVHQFWSEIEHEVVYKNPDFVVYDRFMKSMLGAVRDNLDVVDHQLELIYNEISAGSKSTPIGMDESGFKMLTASSINGIVNLKMKESLGFAMDFKKCASTLAQFIYIKDFVDGENNQERMLNYLELLNNVSENEIEFTKPLQFEEPYVGHNEFCQTVGNHWIELMNSDFEWHVFFVMLVCIQKDTNVADFTNFVETVEGFMVPHRWFEKRFSHFGKAEAAQVRSFFLKILADELSMQNSIDSIHEETMNRVSNTFRSAIEFTEIDYETYEQFMANREQIRYTVQHNLHRQFQKK